MLVDIWTEVGTCEVAIDGSTTTTTVDSNPQRFEAQNEIVVTANEVSKVVVVNSGLPNSPAIWVTGPDGSKYGLKAATSAQLGWSVVLDLDTGQSLIVTPTLAE